MKAKTKWDWPEGRNYMWWHKIPKESVEKVEMMLKSKDDEMKVLGMIGFYHICKVWEDDGQPYRLRKTHLGRPPKVQPINYNKLMLTLSRLDTLKRKMGLK